MIAQGAERYLDLGYDYLLLNASTPGMPERWRHDWLTRFARDVRPHLRLPARAPHGRRSAYVARTERPGAGPGVGPGTSEAAPSATASRQTNIAISRALQQRLAAYNLTSPQMIFMREIWLEEGLSQRELSARVGTAELTTVSALRVLERRKLIRRVARPGDRRAIGVFLTPAGRKLKAMSCRKSCGERPGRRRIAPRDLAVCTRVLAAIRDNARNLVEQEHARAGVLKPRRRWASEA